MIALVVLVEISLERSDRLPTYLSESWRIVARAARREAVDCDILCFGDSQVEFSILPPVLEERLGSRTFNLAVPSGSPASSYVLLRRALDAGSRPGSILVNFSPVQLSGNHEETRLRAWPELASVRDAIELAGSSRDPDRTLSIWLAQALPSYKGRLEIRAMIVSLLKREPFDLAEAVRVTLLRRLLRFNRGAFVMPPSTRAGPDPGELPRSLDLQPEAYSPEALEYVDRFLGLAASHSISVYCLVPPISPEYQARCDSTGSDARYTSFLRGLSRRFPNLVVVDGRHASGYAPTMFVDAIHCDSRGATSITEELADHLLAGPPTGPRWIELGPFRERERSLRVEDLAQSLSVLDRSARGVERR
jgi:hypothetical protein